MMTNYMENPVPTNYMEEDGDDYLDGGLINFMVEQEMMNSGEGQCSQDGDDYLEGGSSK